MLLEQFIQLVQNAPNSNTLGDDMQPSPIAVINSNPRYSNSALISMIEEDGFCEMDTFRWALNYCQENHAVLRPNRLQSFEILVNDLEQYRSYFQQLGNHLEDAPDEFLDSLMETIMLDPVILPSGNRVDRRTIAQLKTNSDKLQDPFTKMEMTMDMIRPDNELKRRIMEYLRKRKRELSEMNAVN